MSKSKIIRYTIYREDSAYSRQTKHPYGSGWRNFESARNWRSASRKAVKMGAGSIIQRLSEKRNGKKIVREWVYSPIKK